MSTISFSKWNDMKKHIYKITGCKALAAQGIGIRLDQETAILRSVDNYLCYDDNLSNINNINYTLFGHYGNQDENEKRYNEPLLNKNKIKNIYVYRVKYITGKKKEYIWYGKYEIIDKNTKLHIDKDNIERTIIVLFLK